MITSNHEASAPENRPRDSFAIANIDPEAFHCFLHEEAPECLLALEQGIQCLSSNAATQENLDAAYPDLIRAAHTLKGGAGMVGLQQLSHLAHYLEELLIALNQGRVPHLRSAYELLSLSLDPIGDLLMRAWNGNDSQTSDLRLQNLIVTLDRFVQDLPPPIPESLETEGVKEEFPHTTESRVNSFVKTALEVDLEDCLQRLTRSLSELTDNPASPDSSLRKSLTIFLEESTLLGETLGLEELTAISREISDFLSQEQAPPEQLAQLAIARIHTLRTETLTPSSPSSPSPQSEATRSSIPERFLKYLIVNPNPDLAPANLTLRVPVTRLDRMSDTLGNLVIEFDRLTLEQEKLQTAIATLSPPSPPSVTAIATDIQQTLHRLKTSLNQLNRDLTDSRLIPFGTLAERFITPLETLQRQYGKQVELVIQGKDRRVDQPILEQLQTPLTHLFRNAFDHGIELPTERKALGKSPTAKITFSATVEGSQLVITVEDDGRGIDPQKVYKRALAMGLIDPEQGFSKTLSPENSNPSEILQFLFTPGFSTASKVTDLSGRGVGLDIVQHQVARLRGTLQVETVLGQGTKFTIAVPLTLSRLSVYLCQCQDHTLAIPADQTIAVVELSEAEIKSGEIGDRHQEIPGQTEPLPIFRLWDLLPYGSQVREAVGAVNPPSVCLILRVKGQRVAIAVDAVLEERPVMLKPLDLTVPVPPYVAGCTVLGSGEVVPVLAPHHFPPLLFPHSPLRRVADVSQDTVVSSDASAPHLLIVDDSLTLRRILQDVFESAGFVTTLCTDGREALTQLARSPQGQFHLILSDVEMPHLDGLGLLLTVRSDPQWHDLPMVMLSSRASPEDIDKGMELGATAYFSKPFNRAMLVAAIRQILVPGKG
ncbi:hybrid sensor histidine kinase/response regulator [Oscillatoria acuminata]|uniref:histidine kinase n=1 Tax=Oscillatoria acuminata PCC 6304 TaxID=56110 RepID=K9TH81_9CYAN|nr:hybrid sensor histidine kinase/response regulator [Oscillatoria acuminata]AFY82232.1 chemotaxis protein histidine kinase-like protein [Oscillatoria acuminata PCC 6304]